MTQSEIEDMNRYAANHYDGFGENEDIEFLFEPEDFEDWLARSESRRGKRRSRKSIKTEMNHIKRYFAAMGVVSEENVKLYKQGLQDRDSAPSFINGNIISIKLYIPSSNIVACLKGRQAYTKNYSWCYVEEEK